jgi:hypothetical protein
LFAAKLNDPNETRPKAKSAVFKIFIMAPN